ncbi:hypothetical protein NMY22_g15151 [Coprinellus aureogranulatus]|nr:hypothetical protein NMY22_g15151 [Coprinellus aureogranulatus]
MPFRKISDDLKEAMLRYRAHGASIEDVTAIGGFSERTFWRALRRKRLTGSAAPKVAIGRGRPRKLVDADIRYLIRLARHKPTMFIDEYNARLLQFRHQQNGGLLFPL